MQQRPKQPRRRKKLLAKHVQTADKQIKKWLWRVEQFDNREAPPKGWHRFLKDGYSISLEQWRVRYDYYLRSNAWEQRRTGAIRRAEGLCDQCGQAPKRIHVHHVHYLTVGAENAEDLRVLCIPCHRVVHAHKVPLPVQMNAGTRKHMEERLLRKAKQQDREDLMAPHKPGIRRRPGGDKTQAVEIPPK